MALTKLAGAVALARRAPLLELRITYDLAFDRVVHHGRLVEFGGASRRMERVLMLGKEGNA